MGKRTPRDPEKEARWAELRRDLQQRIDHNQRLLREARERDERRRRRLRRLTFGFLPR
jgi:hypothetical protein